MTEPIVPPIQSNPDLKRYFCPFCDRFLFKGNVQNVQMVCPHCQKLITAPASDLVKPEPAPPQEAPAAPDPDAPFSLEEDA